MGLFTPKGVVGVDIGTSSIKVVEIKSEGTRNRLFTYGVVDIKNDIVRSDSEESQARLTEALKSIIKKAGVSAKKSISALPSFSVFSAVMELPKMPVGELSSAVKWEARRYIPFPVETMTMDWKVLPSLKSDKTDVPKTRILLNAAPKNLVNKYQRIFKNAGLKLIAIETESFALARSLVGVDATTVAVINIGSTATEVSIIENGLPVLCRGVDMGGRAITSAVANSLNVGMSRAEQFKLDLGAHPEAHGGEIPPAIKPVLQNIVGEVKNTFTAYQTSGGSPVTKVILSGGSAHLGMLRAYLTESLQAKVWLGDPWARLVYPPELKETLLSIAPLFGVAVGLAMRTAN